MIEPDELEEIFAVYRKYGWVLRRVLLSQELKTRLKSVTNDPVAGVEVRDSDLDAAWFSRPPVKGGVAWEIRHLNCVPYAILEQIDEFSEGFEDRLGEVEARLRATIETTKNLDKVARSPSKLSS